MKKLNLKSLKKEVENLKMIHTVEFGVHSTNNMENEFYQLDWEIKRMKDEIYKKYYGRSLSEINSVNLFDNTNDWVEIKTKKNNNILEKSLVVMLRCGKLGIVNKYFENDQLPMKGIIQGDFSNLDMYWSWKENGSGGDLKNHIYDIIEYIGEF